MLNFRKIIYIVIMFSFINNANSDYTETFFDFSINNINEEKIDLAKFKDKTVLLVNVASNCGFTKQYTDLQKLFEKYNDRGLVVLGVPSNQFGKQEPGSNNDIKTFCEVNFDITFPMTSKFDVKGENAHPIYLWAKENHGKSTIPKWNFHKILINKDGKIEETYVSFVNPMSKKLAKKIEEIL